MKNIKIKCSEFHFINVWISYFDKLDILMTNYDLSSNDYGFFFIVGKLKSINHRDFKLFTKCVVNFKIFRTMVSYLYHVSIQTIFQYIILFWKNEYLYPNFNLLDEQTTCTFLYFNSPPKVQNWFGFKTKAVIN